MAIPIYPVIAAEALSARPANFLDTPFIFEQIMAGAESGVFSTGYLGIQGTISAFWLAIRYISRRGKEKECEHTAILFENHQGDSVGFCKMDLYPSEPDKRIHVEIFAVAEPFRAQGFGRSMVLWVNALAKSKNFSLVTYDCNKHAKTMVKILKAVGYKRRKKQTDITVNTYELRL